MMLNEWHFKLMLQDMTFMQSGDYIPNRFSVASEQLLVKLYKLFFNFHLFQPNVSETLF